MSRRYGTEYHRFPSTHWSLIGRASDEATQWDALNHLLQRYLPALRSHLIYRRSIKPQDADDLVQGFITQRILDSNLVQLADAGRGKFRTFLATALDNYTANEIRSRCAKKRAADHAQHLAEEVADDALRSDSRADDVFDVEWAKSLLAESMDRMKAECRATDRTDLWELFELRMMRPIFENDTPPSYDEIVERFQFRSPSQASNALVTAKRMFARHLRATVSEYIREDSEIEGEIEDLRRILARQTT